MGRRYLFHRMAVFSGIALAALTAGCGADRAVVPIDDETAADSRWDLTAEYAIPGPVRTMEGRLNLVVILIDTLRADYLELYGHDRRTAPFLEALGGHSSVFDRAFSSSTCTSPSVASLFTGVYPNRHGVHIGFTYKQQLRGEAASEKAAGAAEFLRHPIEITMLPEELTTLAEVLRAAGYVATGIVANPNLTEETQFDQGFDTFQFHSHFAADDFLALLTESRDAIRSKTPYFLYLHLMDPHAPYVQHAPYFVEQTSGAETAREAYQSEIRFADDHLAKIFELYEMHEDTIVVVLSDHGEEFRDHGGWYHRPTLYRELNQILMMVYGPGIAPQRIPENVSIVDLYPTLLGLLGVPYDPGAPDGVSLAPLLTEAGEPDAVQKQLGERTLFAHRLRAENTRSTDIWAAIHGDRKLIVDEAADVPQELFDLVNDPHELGNLAGKERDTAARLRAEIDAFRSAPRRESDSRVTEVSDALKEELQTLGYVQ